MSLFLFSIISPNTFFFLGRTLFAQASTTIPQLFSSGLSGMVYEHFLGCFIPQDPYLGFSKLFQATVDVAHDDIRRLVA
jgi:hypothetical protein